jgi:hypothetical protein
VYALETGDICTYNLIVVRIDGKGHIKDNEPQLDTEMSIVIYSVLIWISLQFCNGKCTQVVLCFAFPFLS